MIGLVGEAELKVRLECANVLLCGVQPANVSRSPWEVTDGAALQQLKADLKEEAGGSSWKKHTWRDGA